jgi:catechol 2,3-dioxygenase-like lactoylglutathione lyase family enzyme
MSMATLRINHVSVNAADLATSVDFYVGLLGARQIPTLDFGFPVQWLEVGDTQLHLFEKDLQPTSHHHFAVTVDDLEPVYAFAEEQNAFDHGAFGHHLFRLPGDVAQLYVRDPSGNLLEIDAPGASALPAPLREAMRIFEDVHPQSPETLRARLPVTP